MKAFDERDEFTGRRKMSILIHFEKVNTLP